MAAASIWARATARRDGLESPATAEQKLPGIISALQRDRAVLLLEGQDDPTGFALLVGGEHDDLELLYLAVDPAAWASGVAVSLVERVQTEGRRQHSPVTLWVIADDERAVRLYERAGWRATGETACHNGSSRLERRFSWSSTKQP